MIANSAVYIGSLLAFWRDGARCSDLAGTLRTGLHGLCDGRHQTGGKLGLKDGSEAASGWPIC
jgi:hypothetical protein